MDGVSVFLGNLGHFFLDLLFPNIIFGNIEHGIPSILIDKVVEIVLRMTGSRAKTASHLRKCFVSLSFTKLNILEKN